MHQYKAVVFELRRVRAELFEVETTAEAAVVKHTEESDLLKKKLAELTNETHALRQVASSNLGC